MYTYFSLIKLLLALYCESIQFIIKKIYFFHIGDWGLGIGDWGLGIGDWGLGSFNIRISALFCSKSIISRRDSSSNGRAHA